MALALALITLATLVLNAGVFWLLLKQTEEERRTDLALSLSAALTAQLEVEAGRGTERDAGYRRVLSAYQGTALDVHELYVTDAGMKTIAAVAGEAPTVADTGLRAALYGSQQFIDITGPLVGARFVQVTSPVAPRGRPVAALRVSVPLKAPAVPGGVVGFALFYVGGSFGLVSLFGYTLFRRSLVQPVQSLVQGTARIAGGDFGHQVRLDAARELEGLRDALNAMSTSLADYQARTGEQLSRLERANRDLRTAQEALIRSEKLASVGRLAAGLAHEVGNPLAAVLGYVDLMTQGLGDPALEQDLARRARSELERIHRIIRDLLDFARQGSGQVEDVAVGPALEEAWATVAPMPALKGVQVSVEVEAELPAVRIERDKLHQVLVNLLLNAADALVGQARPRVWLRARRQQGAAGPDVEVACLDNGTGFDPVALDRAFEPFFTTKEVGAGTGLGLATCLQVVEAAGGRIEVQNLPEGGACVRLCLPAAP
ncbi:ATP-binding protein [Myxococcota bacterium]|nr:ATP-binding protein [Myxococcota bacterium]